MRRSAARPSAQRKIAFIVDEGKEKLLVEALARKVIARHRPVSRPCLAIIGLWGTPLVGVYSVVELLFMKNYQRFFILFNARTTSRRRISSVVSDILKPLIRMRLDEKVTLIPLVPSIERWVLADEEALERAAGRPLAEERTRGKGQPEEVLRALLGGWGPKEQKRVAKYLDPERIRARDASFDAFARALEDALGRRPEATGPTAGSAP
jgi:hypothetical protein